MSAPSLAALLGTVKKKRARRAANPAPVLPFESGYFVDGVPPEHRVIGQWLRLPLHTNNGLNAREHWAARSRRVKKERGLAGTVVPSFALPCTVTLVRISPGLLDDDNLRGALKGVRDGIADRLGVDDRDPRVTWVYAQERAKGYAVRVELRPIVA
ncbi:hypothetical protein Bcep22_gp23 [Burkholderia phage Bcep22]|uniref:Uncharacterized protein n=1 Tax=Burkholderia phage Bcep22 TaxID=2883944 RepID=Q6V7S1_9CAUD|nr:hypothetical protein Bcep22_gp23 [Burkholderia phage Bcep22]AAQ54957.1 hypothetical protein Bcep22_gp23 [Burkholderia phage Bcep22]